MPACDALDSSAISKKTFSSLKTVAFILLVIGALPGLRAEISGLESPGLAEDPPSTIWGIHGSPKLLEIGSVSHVEKDRLYADSLSPGSFKMYVTEAREKCLLIFSSVIDTEGAKLEVEAEGLANRTEVNVVWLPEPHIYYLNREGEVQILVRNPEDSTVYYRFYVDISEPLANENSKALPLEDGQAFFHVDLRKGDRVLLSMNDLDHSDWRIRVFVLYHEILGNKEFYSLYLYRQSLYGMLYFDADLAGRYYIIADSRKGEQSFSLRSLIASPPWNREWFWLAIPIAFLAPLILLTYDERIRKLGKTRLVALFNYLCWFVTAGSFVSAVGGFSYGTSVYIHVFFVFMTLLGLSYASQIYAAYSDRKRTTGICRYCGREVNLHEENYCCGKIVKNVSVAWFLTPLSLSLLFFSISYSVFVWASPHLIGHSLWVGSCGSLVGGIIAWRINRDVYNMGSWKRDPERYNIPPHIPFVPIGLLIEGILLSFASPLLIGFLLETFLTQHVESFLLAKRAWIRTRIAPLTLPFHITLTSIVLALGLALFVFVKSRRILSGN